MMSPDNTILITDPPVPAKKKPRKTNKKKKKAKTTDDALSSTDETFLSGPRLFEVKHTGDDLKGLGLFATEAIPRGTRLLVEPVAWRIDVQGEGCSEADAIAIWDQIPALTQAQLLTLAKHYTARGHVVRTISEFRIAEHNHRRERILEHRDANRPRIRELTHDADDDDDDTDPESDHTSDAGAAGATTFEDDAYTAALADLTAGIAAEHASLERAEAIAVLQMNHFILTDTSATPSVRFLGVCPTASRLNNACIPNASHTYHSGLKALVVHAIHPIPKGAEITIAYTAPLNTGERRREAFMRTGFACDCACCADTPEGRKMEKRRARMMECAAYMQYWIRDGEEGGADGAEVRVALDGKEVLKRGNELIRMLGEDGLKGNVLVQARMQQAHIAARCGSRRQAIMHAEKAVEEARISVGEDHPEFRNNWVEAEVLKRKMLGVGVIKDGKNVTKGAKASKE